MLRAALELLPSAHPPNARLAIFSLASGQEVNRWQVREPASALAFNPDNRTLAVGYDHAEFADIYDAEDGAHLADLPIGGRQKA